jgi:hypothetical protein
MAKLALKRRRGNRRRFLDFRDKGARRLGNNDAF